MLSCPTTAAPKLREARDALERAFLAAVLRRAASNAAVSAKIVGRNWTDFYDLLRRRDVSTSEREVTAKASL